MNGARLREILYGAAYRAAAQIYPRRCPLCGEVLGTDAVAAVLCRNCLAGAKKLLHNPPRLADTEHSSSAIASISSLLAAFTAERIRTVVFNQVRFWHPDSFSFISLAANGAQVPFSIRPTVRFLKFRSVRWSMNCFINGKRSAL